MDRIKLKDIILAGGIIGLAVLMIFDLVRFRGSVAGTIGPGVYPAVAIALIIVTGLVIIIKAFVPIRFRLIVPFLPEGLQGLMIAKLPGILAQGVGERLAVKGAVGQGFFSARHLAAKAKPDGSTFVVVTGDMPGPSCFYNAAANLKEIEPVALLSFDPYVLVGKAGGAANGAASLSRQELIEKLASGPMGFSFQKEVANPLRLALGHRTGLEIRQTLPESTQLMLADLQAGKIATGLCPLSDLIGSAEFKAKGRLLAVGSLARLPEFPDAPTLLELGLELVWGLWMGLALPKGTSSEIVEKTWSLLSREDNLQALRADIRHNGGLENIRGPEEFRELLAVQSKAGAETGADQGVEIYQKTATLGKVSATVAVFVAFLLLAPFVGYLPSSLVFLAGLSFLLWPRGRKKALPLILAVSVGVGGGIYLIFSQVFDVIFP
jgi:tripartite-type tricarboxylate transporter receptor subunit TctC